jgi:hypothetical protein
MYTQVIESQRGTPLRIAARLCMTYHATPAAGENGTDYTHNHL